MALADGSVYRGRAFGAVSRGVVSVGEVVFNTAMSGYQESLTDPSYTGQILVETFPLIGNTGVNAEDVESAKVQVAGFVVRELARLHSNYRAESDLSAYLAGHGVLGLEGIDTRSLTKRLRTGGAMPGVLTDRADLSDAELVEMARRAPSMAGQNLVPKVTCSTKERWTEGMGDWGAGVEGATAPASLRTLGEVGGTRAPRSVVPSPAGARYRVLAFDCGAKRNILRNLTERGCEVTVVPFDTPAAEVKRLFEAGETDGVFISNGPGDPAAVEPMIRTLRELIRGDGPAIPTFGICLGHQLLSLAAGARTYKLPFGHRGINQPVLNVDLARVEITSQNHGFAVDPASLEAAGGEVTHLHLNDGTVSGFRLRGRPVFSVQYHPEASPGPHDAGYLFDAFVAAMAEGRSAGVGR